MRSVWHGGLIVLLAFLIAAPAALADRQVSFVLSDGTLGNGKTELVAQVQHSTHVVTFFTAGHHWMTFPAHQDCGGLGLRAATLCARARATLSGHVWLRNLAGKRLLVVQQREAREAIVKRLQAGLAGTPLYPYAARFEQAGRQWNVNPFFMAAISGTESGFGVANSAAGNAWGIGPGINLYNFGNGIDYLARLLAEDYNLSSTVTVGTRYAACGTCWGARTSWFMQARFGADPSFLYYPRAARLSA